MALSIKRWNHPLLTNVQNEIVPSFVDDCLSTKEVADNSGGIGECGSQFDPTTGLPISGPAKEKHLRLLEYKVTPQDGDGVYLVTDK